MGTESELGAGGYGSYRIRFGEVIVEPGDLVFGDIDGLCIVPRAIEDEVISKALAKVQGERRMFKAIQGGLGAQAAWEEFGIM